jgi:tRNA G18 (ribose-2'-O)-methylase SpoU
MELKTLWERANQLARSFTDATPSSPEFRELLPVFQQLQTHDDPSLQKVGRLAVIFEGHWTQRQWLNLLIPLERFLDRRLTDAEILGALPDRPMLSQAKVPLVVIADHWRSAFNVGALFRLADGFGINKVYLTGYTPSPDHPSVQKTAMGSSDCTPWEHWESTLDLIEHFKSSGIKVWALETSSSAHDLGVVTLPKPLAIILGNERFGLDPKILKACDGTVRIPLRGIKNSMNVANCFGIFAFEWCRQHAE